jgi:hypothetical protein
MRQLDGRGAHPASFEVAKDEWVMPTYLTLASADIQEGGAVWLRYRKLH